MKHNIKRTFALIIAMLFAIPTFAYADVAPENEIIIRDEANIVALDGLAGDDDEALAGILDPGVEEVDVTLGQFEDAEEPAESEPEPEEVDPNAVVVYCFIVDNTLVATQEAKEGDEILRPEDPDAPEGMAFEGWYLSDGTPLFADADGDGWIDAVIAHPDPFIPEVNVEARFVEAPEETPLSPAPLDGEAAPDAPEADVPEADLPEGEADPDASGADAPEPIDVEIEYVENDVIDADAVADAVSVIDADSVIDVDSVIDADPVIDPADAAEVAEEAAEAAGGVIPEEEAEAEEAGAEEIEAEEAEPETTEVEVAEAEAEPFEQSVVIGGVRITVAAEPGVFPPDATLSVTQVPVYRQQQADAAIDDVRDEEQQVVVSYTFDIKVLDAEGNEIQPTEGSAVQVSFALQEAEDENLESNVYHVTEEAGQLTAEKLDADVEGDTVTAQTDGFSLYTVEFTYNTLEYVLAGGESVALADILSAVGLTGEAEAVEVSDASLFYAARDGGAWRVYSRAPFSSREWMRVTISGFTYEITVTDATVITSGSRHWSGEMSVPDNFNIVIKDKGNELTARVKVESDTTLTIGNNASLFVPLGIHVPKGVTLTIKGKGTLIAGQRPDSVKYDSSVDPCERYCAGIGGGWYFSGSSTVKPNVSSGDCGTIIIDMEGTVYAYGSIEFGNNQGGAAAGIGGGFEIMKDSPTKRAGNGGTVEVKNGTVIAMGGECGAGIGGAGGTQDVPGGDGGTFKISGGKVTATGGEYAAGIGGGYLGSGKSVSISGGTVIAQGGTAEKDEYGEYYGSAAAIGGGYLGDGGVITITGGTTTATSGSQSAGIGGGCGGNGGTITIKDGAVVEATSVSFGAGIGGGAAVVHTNGRYVGGNGGTITIESGANVTATGGIGGAGIGGGDLGNSGSITIDGSSTIVNAQGGGYAAGIGGGNGVTGDDSTPPKKIKVNGDAETIIIKGGTITAKGGSGSNDEEDNFGGGAGIGGGYRGEASVGSNGMIKITGGKIEAVGGAAGGGSGAGIGSGSQAEGKGKIIIEGGQIEASAGKGGAGIGGGAYSSGCTITISNAQILQAAGGEGGAGIGGGLMGDGGNITINGTTTVKNGNKPGATGGLYAAGIGGGRGGNGGTIAIGDTVTVHAVGGQQAAGIGGGSFVVSSENGFVGGNSGTITISGGTSITAISGSVGGAGIGGGLGGNGQTITISGGNTITATSLSGGGAGIGGGADYSQSTGGAGGTINISTSGTIVATGSAGGAGIGGGEGSGKSDGSGSATVIISNAKITATGGKNAAGIGGGQSGDGNVTINSGAITATAGEGGSGIGGGANGKGAIVINNGTISATAGASGAGIGGAGGSSITIKDGMIEKALGGAKHEIEVSGQTITNLGGAGIGGSYGGSNISITIEGGEIVTVTGKDGGAGIGGGALGNGGTIKISGGTFGTVTGGEKAAGIGGGRGYKLSDTDTQATGGNGGSITITGGKFTEITGGTNAAGIGGGSLGSGSAVDAAITIGGTAEIQKVQGGTAAAGIGSGFDDAFMAATGGTILIQGDAKINECNGGLSAAGIGGGTAAAGGTITIEGNAKVAAQGGENFSDTADIYGGAGIGGGWGGKSGTIVIKGQSEVTSAKGGLGAAGIGGGSQASGVSITIDGSAKVKAEGGAGGEVNGKDIYGGAGIGGGYGGKGGTIEIKGGEVESTGGDRGAGIGGGYSGDGGTINISGGTIKKAEGGRLGAGIGGGMMGDGGTITITGGTTKKALGGTAGAGIGGGQQGNSGTISIGGDAVLELIEGGFYAAGIGGGWAGSGESISFSGTASVVAKGGQAYQGNGSGAGVGGGACYKSGSTVLGGEGGTIIVSGGTIEATAGASSDSSLAAMAFGMGGGGEDKGTLSLGSYLARVLAGATKAAAEAAGPVNADQRVAMCQSNVYGKIMPCEPHNLTNGRLTLTTHSGGCQYCGMSLSEETHTFTNGACVCGALEVTYQNADGSTAKHVCEAMTASTGALKGNDWSEGWYAVSKDTKISERVTVSGTVNLILCDGATLEAFEGITVPSDAALNIYIGKLGTTTSIAGTGALVAGKNGDTVSVTDKAAGIGGLDGAASGTITINGGSVTACGASGGAGIGGGNGAAGGAVTVNGGTVEATGAGGGMAIGHGNNATESGTLDFGTYAARVLYGDSSATASRTPALYSERVKQCQENAYAKIELCESHECGYDDAIITENDHTGYCLYCNTKLQTEAHDFQNGLCVCGAAQVKYAGADGATVTKVCQNLTDTMTGLVSNGWSGGWYAVTADTKFDSRVSVTGSVNLILCDGVRLEAIKGIEVAGNGNSLTIFAGSIGDAIAGTGALIAGKDGDNYTCESGKAGIGGDGGTITINGGIITAAGGSGAVGIGGANSTVSLNYSDATKAKIAIRARGYDGTVKLLKAFVDGEEGEPQFAANTTGVSADVMAKMADRKLIADGMFVSRWKLLQQQINEANNGDVIDLVDDVNALSDDVALVVPANKEVTIRLNGFTIDRRLKGKDAQNDGHIFTINGNLTIVNGDANGTGKLTGGNNTASGGGVIVNQGGVFTLSGGQLVGNTSGANGGGVYVNGGECTLSGGLVGGNGAANGGGVYVNSGTFTQSGADIRKNSATGDGGAIYVNGGECSLSSGIIKENSATNGGAVYAKGGTFAQSGGSIETNTATGDGGGVYVNGGAFTLSGGNVVGNGAANGGGAYVKSGTFTQSNGNINENTATDGGGVYVAGGSYGLSGGSVLKNKATGGGGAYLNGGAFTQSGGNLKENTATDGGGVYVADGTFGMQGGSITGNTASGNGGGVYAAKDFSLSGAAEINGNTDGGADPAPSNVTLVYAEEGGIVKQSKIAIAGKLTGQKPIGVSYALVNTAEMPETLVFTSGLGGNGDATNFANEIEGRIIGLNGDGEGIFGVGYKVTVDNSTGAGDVIPDRDPALYLAGETVTLDVQMSGSVQLNSLTYTEDKEGATPVDITPDENGVYAITMPAADVTVTAMFTMGPVFYLDLDDNEIEVEDYKLMSANTLELKDGAWYAVAAQTVSADRIQVNGDVNLILCDGAELSAPEGIHVGPGSSLTIWAQSTGDAKGRLRSNCPDPDQASIGGDDGESCGTITINGGDIQAFVTHTKSEEQDGDDYEINVEFSSGYAAGIGGGSGGSGGTITINRGDIEARGCKYAAGIGGGYKGGSGAITIHGGNIVATSGSYISTYIYSSGNNTYVDVYEYATGYGAGIGGGEEGNGGVITIHGGTIKATSSNGAGIGGGKEGNGGVITINGGTIKATSDNGAAIGGGSAGGDGGAITIHGGTIDAHGYYGAGIGGGANGGNGGVITINGGDITAYTECWGAGIGGGYQGSGGVITINGGNVKATGGGENTSQATGAGIGGGNSGNGGKITITGGTITAGSTRGGSGIGGGAWGDGTELTILGGTITASTSKAFTYTADHNTYKNARAIGRGCSGGGDDAVSNSSTITFGNYQTRVLVGANKEEATPAKYDQREARCLKSVHSEAKYVRMEPCEEHSYTDENLVPGPTTHWIGCDWCGHPKEGSEEPHSFDADGKCRCGLYQQVVTFPDVVNQTVPLDQEGNVLMTYGEDPETLLAESSLGAQSGEISYSSSDTTIAIVNEETGELELIGSGDVVITATAPMKGIYAQGSGTYKLKVVPKELTITAGSDTKVYDGTPLTKNSYTNTALASGDKFTSVTVTGSQTKVGSSNNVPSATIENAKGTDVTKAYNIHYTNGTLKVTAKEIDVKADAKQKVFGEKDPTLTYAVQGLIGKDKLSGDLARDQGEDVGDYAINVGSLKNANYAINYTGAVLKILKADGDKDALTDAQKPTAQSPTYNDSAQDLVVAPTELPEGFTKVQYSTDGGVTWSDTIPTGTDAGDYTLQTKYVGDKNHNDFVADTIAVTMAKADGDKDALTSAQRPTAQKPTYNESQQNLVAAPDELPKGYTKVQYSTDGGQTWSDTIPAQTDAGEYTLQAKYIGDKNHNDFIADPITVTVAKADGDKDALTDAQKPTAQKPTYNETDQALVTAPDELPKGYTKVQYSIDGGQTWSDTIPAQTDAGDYTLQTKYVGDKNHNDLIADPITVTVAKADGDKSKLTSAQKPAASSHLTGTGREQPLVTAPTEMPRGYTKAQYSTDGGQTWSDAVPTGTDAGSYTVQIKYVGDKNHNDLIGDPVTVTIRKLPASGMPIAMLESTGETSLRLTWNALDGVDGFDVFMTNCGSDEFQQMGSVDADKPLTWTFSDLKPQRGYKAYIQAWVVKDGAKSNVLAPSPVAHAYTDGGNKRLSNPGSLTLKNADLTIRLGKTAKISAKVKGVKRGTILAHDGKLRYYSSDTNVAKVSSRGKIKAVGPGSCVIYVLTTNGICQTVTVNVDASLKSLKFTKSLWVLRKDKTINLLQRLKKTPTRAITDLKWSSSDTDVAVVDANGKVKAVGLGTAYITVIDANTNKKARTKIVVK